MKLPVTVLTALTASAGIYLAIGAALALSQSPSVGSQAGAGLDFAAIRPQEAEAAPPELETWTARDGASLGYRAWTAAQPDAPAIVLLHGSSWHSRQFDRLGARLSAAGYRVVAPDLRGHGEHPSPRGDVSHVGQLEEDLADLVAHLKLKESGRTLIVAGHSSGGGLVVRFAGGEHGGLADGFVLLAPYLGYNAPTTRPQSGGWASPATRRIIGLTMLNAVGIHALDHLPVIAFKVPDLVRTGPLGHTVTDSYSHRLNTSYAPRRDFAADLARLDRPFLLLAGDKDEAFVADKYEETISASTRTGAYRLIENEGHLGIVDNEEAGGVLLSWLQETFPQ